MISDNVMKMGWLEGETAPLMKVLRFKLVTIYNVIKHSHNISRQKHTNIRRNIHKN